MKLDFVCEEGTVPYSTKNCGVIFDAKYVKNKRD